MREALLLLLLLLLTGHVRMQTCRARHLALRLRCCTYIVVAQLTLHARACITSSVATVTIHHDEPLIAPKDLRQLMSLCCVADALIERVQKLPGAADAFDVSLLQQIEECCERISPKEPPQV